MVHQTLDGAIGALVGKAPELARAVDEQVEVIAQLRAEADQSYAEAVRTVGVQSADGTLLRGEVLARWHEFVGTGEFFRALEQKISWLRDRVVSVFRGEPPEATQPQGRRGVGAGVAAPGRGRRGGRAGGGVLAGPCGRPAAGRPTARWTWPGPPRSSRATAERAIRDWQGAVLDLVADEGMGKRSKARFLALGVNGIGMALMVVVFAQTGGITGAEVGVAGGTAVLAQRVLEAVFGDQAIRRLAQTAKDELDARVQALMSAELLRYHHVLDGLAVESDQAERLRQAAAAVQQARADGLPEASAGALERGLDEAALPAAERTAVTGAAAGDPGAGARNGRRRRHRRRRAGRVAARGVPLMAGRGLALLRRQRPGGRPGRPPQGADRGGGAVRGPGARRGAGRGPARGRARRPAARALRQRHRGGAGRGHRLGQVQPVQRPVRNRPGHRRRTPAHHGARDGRHLG